MKTSEVSAKLAGSQLSIKTGHVAFQAHGAVTLTIGDVVILVAAAMGEAKEGMDFFPLLVDYEEKFYASGKIKGSRFMKREGRPPDESILKARIIDRPIRPLFPKGIINECVITAQVISSDGKIDPGPHSITAASAALVVGGFPIAAPVAGVRMGYMNGEFIVNPTYEQVEQGELELTVAGTAKAVIMVEAGAKQVSDEIMIKAISLAHEEIKNLCALQEDLRKKAGKKLDVELKIALPNEAVEQELLKLIPASKLDTLFKPSKHEVYLGLRALVNDVLSKVSDKITASDEKRDGIWTEKNVTNTVDKIFKDYMRKAVLEKGRRVDLRKLDEVRPISIVLDFLPNPHGSAVFQRGETQILSVVTLGSPGSAQIIDLMDVDDFEKHYFHHYHFPGYAVGEARGNRGVGRREIGHGFLAERALEPVLPDKEKFPYTIRVVSETLSCNGSSSMGSVCGSTLALMAAGVPISSPVVGVAMGMVTDDEKHVLLTDIQGLEDFFGDMDLKYAGTSKGITALQMDIKVTGISVERMKEAFDQAKKARDLIAKEMEKAIAAPRGSLSPRAPMIETMKINPEMIRMVIGKGGETINGIIKECGVEIDIEDDGLIFVTAPNREAGEKAMAMIKIQVYEPKVGDVLEGTVNRIMEFGAFVDIPGGKDGMIHISKLSRTRVNKVTDVVNMGDRVKVKILEIDQMGRINLTLVEKLK